MGRQWGGKGEKNHKLLCVCFSSSGYQNVAGMGTGKTLWQQPAETLDTFPPVCRHQADFYSWLRPGRKAADNTGK